jgi:glutathione S-transferase
MAELLGAPYSPWTERARWALEARRIPYEFRVYAPLVGEPALRLRLRRWSGKVSVPVFFADDGEAVADSLDIARWADAHGEGPRLFPADHEADVARIIALSEAAMNAGRGFTLLRLLEDREALLEMVPGKLRRPLGPLGVPIAAFGTRRTMRKYGSAGSDEQAHRDAYSAALTELSYFVAGRTTPIFGTFSFADIAACQALPFIAPPPFGLKFGNATRRVFTDDALAARYADLVRWRDAMYSQHRPR